MKTTNLVSIQYSAFWIPDFFFTKFIVGCSQKALALYVTSFPYMCRYRRRPLKLASNVHHQRTLAPLVCLVCAMVDTMPTLQLVQFVPVCIAQWNIVHTQCLPSIFSALPNSILCGPIFLSVLSNYVFISSDRSSYSDGGLLYIYIYILIHGGGHYLKFRAFLPRYFSFSFCELNADS